MRRPGLLLASLGLTGALLCARPAAALDFKVGGESLRLDITESMWLAWHADNGNSVLRPGPACPPGSRTPACNTGDVTDDNYGEVLNRLNAQLAWRRFLLSARFDSGYWFNTPSAEVLRSQAAADRRFVKPDFTAYRGYGGNRVPLGVAGFYLEKLSASYIGRDVEVTLGDFYVNLGRGLVLSIRKIDELGVDTTLTGAKLLVHKGDWSATVVGGYTNVQNFDQARAQWIDESNDLVTGASVGYRIARKLTLTANAMFGIPTCATAARCTVDPYTQAGGAYVFRPGLAVDAPRLLPWMGLYLEYARRQDGRSTPVAGLAADDGSKRTDGNALYGAIDFFLGAINLQLEGKWYDNYQPWHAGADPFGSLVYMVPPTLERIKIQLNNNTDIIAGRAKVSTRLSRKASVYVSGQLAQSRPSQGAEDSLVDLVGGGEIRWNDGRSHFFPTVEYRNEHQNAKGGLAPLLEEELVAIEWDFSQELPRRFALDSEAQIWFRKKPNELVTYLPTGQVAGTLDQNGWVEGQAYLKLAWASKLALVLGYEFTSANNQRLFTHDFLNAQLKWNITPGTSITATGGGYRGGLKCVSGVCRVFPPFQGAMLEVVVRL